MSPELETATPHIATDEVRAAAAAMGDVVKNTDSSHQLKNEGLIRHAADYTFENGQAIAPETDEDGNPVPESVKAVIKAQKQPVVDCYHRHIWHTNAAGDVVPVPNLTPEQDKELAEKNRQLRAELDKLDPAKADKDQKYLDKNFRYHAPKGTQTVRYELLRAKAKEFAEAILHNVPDSRERSTALTQLENAMFWANAGIARNE